MKTVGQLTKKELTQLKEFYVSELVNEGLFGEIIFDDEDIKEPSYSFLININEFISDEFIINYYSNINFSDDDFLQD